MDTTMVFGAVSLTAWIYLVLGQGHFWRCSEMDRHLVPAGDEIPVDPWPDITAVIPARNEAGLIDRATGSLLKQDYPGRFTLVLVDDQSADQTASIAQNTAFEMNAADRLTVIQGSDPPLFCTGKLCAMMRGLAFVNAQTEPPDFVLFVDADIAFDAGALRQLVEGAITRKTILTSLMVKLHCDSFAERMFIPAFIFFFQKLYPFAWINNPSRRTAAAAGGCMLVRRDVLSRAGGLVAIRSALIDDCALAALLKPHGPIWLGLTESAQSLRAAPRLGDIRRMVSRSAYAQLRYSPLLLCGTLIAMTCTYVAPPLVSLFATGTARSLGIASWGLMSLAYIPTLRFYRLNLVWALALPAIAVMYMLFTIDSGLQHWRGRGGAWKGRFQAAGSPQGKPP